jgi:hypothetical protein
MMFWPILVVTAGLVLFWFLGGLDGGLVNLVLLGGAALLTLRLVIRHWAAVART